MPTLVQDPAPPEFTALLERRRALGQDVLDEVWEGVYVVNPVRTDAHWGVSSQLAVIFAAPARNAGLWPRMRVFNLGEPDDYRIPDGGVVRERTTRTYRSTAALVVEIVSPGGNTPRKIPFYAKHGVDELVIIDLQQQAVTWLALGPDGSYTAVERSRLIELSALELAGSIDWPELPDE